MKLNYLLYTVLHFEYWPVLKALKIDLHSMYMIEAKCFESLFLNVDFVI